MLAGLTGFAMSIAAAGLIYYSWQQRRQTWAAAAGWLLAFGSAFVWPRALGPEFGVTYAIIIFVCLVWVQIAFTIKIKAHSDNQSVRRPLQDLSWPGMHNCIKHGMLFLLSVPAAAVIALMLSVALVLYLPWTMPVKFAVAIFLYPVLWGALSAWICAQDKLVKPALASVVLLAVSSLLLFT